MCLVALSIVFASNQKGIINLADTYFYLISSQWFAEGYGLVIRPGSPFTEHPPLMTIVLSPIHLLSHDLSFLPYFQTIMLVTICSTIYWLLRKNSTPTFAAVGTCFFLTNHVFINTYVSVQAEALYLITSLMAVNLFLDYVAAGSRKKLCACALFLSLGFMTRYVAISNIFAISIALVFLTHFELRKKTVDLIILIVVSLSTNIVWALRNASVENSLFGREILTWRNAPWEDSLVYNIGNALYPLAGRDLVSIVGLIFIGTFALIQLWIIKCSFKNNRDHHRFLIFNIMSLTLFFYFIITTLSHYLFDPVIKYDERLAFVPLFFACIGLMSAWKSIFPLVEGHKTKIVLIAGSYLFISTLSVGSVTFHRALYGDPSSRIELKSSFVTSVIVSLQTTTPDDFYIYTDSFPFLYYYAGLRKKAKVIPKRWNGYRENTVNSQEKIQGIKNKLDKGVAVYWHEAQFNEVYHTISTLSDHFKFRLIASDSTSKLYQILSK